MDSRDKRQLESLQITHILTVLEHKEVKDKNSNENHMFVEADDKSTEDLSKNFQKCNDFINSGRQSGGNVLIHCRCGKSRSVTIATAYIMKQLECWEKNGNVILRKVDGDLEFCADVLKNTDCSEGNDDKCFFVDL
uniref:Tyrosine specific protein phosphatases domain-containing protein n=1 Tax=Megaselia scalaris TaxID=36166 RepID=T1GDE7_MEGSC